ncbi:TetR/AcrR family transcriptional regulator [Novosphingobium humi]|uniref:Helix-turn-helix domain containing protein n=1 Tax=Novosphingobium humi TaxID=2282397 RepID=A0ABY7U132_9SPHN|nr:TetR/AcrR family transcriptional regulator [Novosphingobium humi]WCT77814.1 helix-turn-helix domain containing protein [Novosphingobium humi]WJS98676.1 TetR/AcrR family transcriptional regulator [Novosphingobium humi]
MGPKKRLSPEASRNAAMEAARDLLVEQGPQGVTLKAVAARVGRTHANLLHHFGSAAELQKALAEHMAVSICASVARAVLAQRDGSGSARDVVDLAFDAFGKQGGGQLVSWMRLIGNVDALDTIVRAIHAIVDEVHDAGEVCMRHVTQTLVLLALGDSMIGAPLSDSLEISRDSSRELAARLIETEAVRLGLVPAERALTPLG